MKIEIVVDPSKAPPTSLASRVAPAPAPPADPAPAPPSDPAPAPPSDPAPSDPAPPPSGGGSASGAQYTVYADAWLSDQNFPTAADIDGYTAL